jgi:hypothetical protein
MADRLLKVTQNIISKRRKRSMKKRSGRTSNKFSLSKKTWFAGALLTVVLMLPYVSFAARPLVTDDSGTLGKGKYQVEFGMETFSWKDRGDGVKIEETGTEASGVFTYGILDNVDVVAGFPYAWGKVKENSTTAFDANRLSDISLEAKWRFYEKNGFGLALKPGITLPMGNYKKGFGTGRATYGLTFIASKEIEPFGFHFNAGYTRNENKVDERKDLYAASVAATYEMIKGLNAVGNIGFERNADPTVQTTPAFALVGLNYSVNDHIMLDAGYRFGLNKQEVDYAIIAGVTFNF